MLVEHCRGLLIKEPSTNASDSGEALRPEGCPASLPTVTTCAANRSRPAWQPTVPPGRAHGIDSSARQHRPHAVCRTGSARTDAAAAHPDPVLLGSGEW